MTIARMPLPPAVADLFQEPFWLRPEWRPFEDALLNAPSAPGIYALGLPRGIRYDGGISCIAYVGSAVNLQRRLSQHLPHHHNSNIWQLRQSFGELSVSWWLFPHFDQPWLLTVEGETICRFERQFGTIPVCNLAVQPTPHAKLLRDLVTIAECTAEKPIALDDLKPLGFRVRPRFRPGLVKQSITANEWFYNGVEWPTKEQIEAHLAEADRKNWQDAMACVGSDAVMAWSLDKMRALVKAAQSLVEDKQPSTVIRCQAICRDVPRPHTWGEVALVKARLIASAWYPAKRVWVKILCGKELLGQAFMDQYSFRGEDKSDLPQRAELRASEVADVAAIESRFQQAIED